ncbi:MAG: response regulator [Deltaproteobacteria bacterium]|nr:response regulator [Deltaproteobacteria bacterium]MBW2129364.1 response regulator [Deltaproteobacteria bacterium]
MQIQVAEEPTELTLQRLQSSRVLVVDDERVISESLQLYLEHLGIRDIHIANDGREALRMFQENHFDFVFLDIMMPEVSGLDVLKKINESDQLTTVILMTGYPTMDVVIDAMHNGASDFLVKPFRFEDLKIALERIQRLHLLMERNCLLNQELLKKREVEELNNQLERKIRLQGILYHIVDSLSKINRSENLYRYVITKAIESCNAKRACFLIYDQENSHLLTLAQQGFEKMNPGTQARFLVNSEGSPILEKDFIANYFSCSPEEELILDRPFRTHDLLATPFNIRDEPFGVLLVSEKEGGKAFDGEDEFILKFLAEKAALNIENLALYDNLKQNFLASLMALVTAIEAKDTYTQQHSTRVTTYALKIARNMGCEKMDLNRLETMGPLHDIGKIGIPDSILNKPGPLTEEETECVRAHPTIGVNIVAPLGLDEQETAIIKHHHERWDGKGYPDGLKGEEIPKLARILAVADAFDAMNSDRAYRKALPFDVCLDELRRNSGSQFDPKVVKAAIPVLSQRESQSGTSD